MWGHGVTSRNNAAEKWPPTGKAEVLAPGLELFRAVPSRLDGSGESAPEGLEELGR